MTPLPTTVSPDLLERAAQRLQQARRTGTPCAPVRDLIGSTDAVAAYAVQQRQTDARIADGARVVGHKIGLTSPAVQRQLGVDRPDFGVLFDDMAFADGDTVPAAGLLQPRIEAEIAFVLSDDLADGELDLPRIRSSIAYATAALEIVDSRVAGWDITFADTVADNASSAAFVLGHRVLPVDRFEPAAVTMTLSVDGAPASHGDGSACLGDPLRAVQWLARTCRELGEPLRRGQVVLSGALGPMVALGATAHVSAEVHPLGTVSATVSGAASAAAGVRR